MKNTSNLIILGPQGSGKGTQAELLVKKFSYVLLGSGDMLREIAQADTPLGKEVHQTINVEGRMVEPELITKVIKEKLAHLPNDQKLILDSYPRNMAQYVLFREFWPQTGRSDCLVVFIELSEEEGVKRLLLRKRLDDTEAAIRQRFELFNAETLPMVKAMERDGEVVRIDGSPSIEQVHEEIVRKLEKR